MDIKNYVKRNVLAFKTQVLDLVYATKEELPSAITDAVNDYLDEHPVSEVTMEELASQPIVDAKTVSGTFRNAYNGSSCSEKADNVVDVTITVTNRYNGVFFNVDIDPTKDNIIEFTIDTKSAETESNYLPLVCYVMRGNNDYISAPTSQIQAPKTGIGTYTQTITKEYIANKGLTSPLVIGVTSKTASRFDVSVTNTYNESSTVLDLINDVKGIKSDKALSGKKVIFLGDSITALTGERSWVDKFCNLTGANKVVNVAVASATLTDTSSTVLDGNPTSSTNNTLANQVQKIINNQYEAPDLIIIAIGTNSGIFANETSVKATYVDSDNNLVPLENLNRTVSEGAFRWANETLHGLYPNAIICWCNPIQAAHGVRENSSVVNWANALRTLTNYGGVINIETNRCGIMMANEVNGANGEDLQDGLHPNSNGATKIARYNASAISRLFS